MFSRMANVATVSKKTPMLFRLVATSSSNSNAAASVVPSKQGPPAGVRAYPHDAPERDFVNFPPPRVAEESGKTRTWIVPVEWCEAMYSKTGVTGPYVLFWGAVATILSKEYFVASVDFGSQCTFIAMIAVLSKYAGPKISAFLSKECDKWEKDYKDNQDLATKNIVDKINELDSLNALPEANTLIHAAKKENVQLQLESEYRERMQQVYNDVKKRLDYQVSVQTAYKRVEREQAINYINGEVAKSIGPNQEREAFQSGLEQLKALSKKYAGSI